MHEATSSSIFCYDCVNGWLQSEERKLVDWTSDASYEEMSHKYASKIIQAQEVIDE